MVINENLYEKYNNLRENLAELLLLKEEIISIRNDLVLEDEEKFKLLYKKNIESLVEVQKHLERDVMNLFRANEILKILEFSNNFVDVGQVYTIINSENNKSKKFNSNEVKNFVGLFDELDIEENKNCDDVFKAIAKEISPHTNSENWDRELWKKTLKAKADDSKRTMNKIFKTIEEKRLNKSPIDFNIDEYSKNIRTLENNLEFLEREVRNLGESCKDTLDEKKVKKMTKLLKKVENKKVEINHSIEILTKIRNGLVDGFIASLPANKNGMLN